METALISPRALRHWHRLEAYVSRAARDQIRDKLNYGIEDWAKSPSKTHHGRSTFSDFRMHRRTRERTLLGSAPRKSGSHLFYAAIILALVAGGAGLIWQQPWRTKIEAASMDKMAFALPDKPSLAVMPFSNISNDKDQDYFADGLTEDIITDISKVSGIFVVASGSTAAYKGKSVKVKQVAEDLGVRYVLAGSIRRSGDQLRITAKLADTIKGSQIWADRFDRKVDDVFAVQSEITRQVVRALAVTLKANEHDRLYQKYVTNIDAYEAFIKARAAAAAPTRENIERSEGLFKHAIELDPKFAGGYAGLSFNYSVKARFRYGDKPKEDAILALEMASKAIEADNEFAWSHIALAGAQLANGNHDRAVDAARRAIVIQPNGFESNLFMGFYLNFAGQSDEAVKYLEIANELSRIDTIRGLDFLGMAYFIDGNYAKSEEVWIRRFDRLGIPNYPIAHVFLAAAQVLSNHPKRAKTTVERFRRISPNFQMSKWLWINNYKLPEHRKRLYEAALKAGIPE